MNWSLAEFCTLVKTPFIINEAVYSILHKSHFINIVYWWDPFTYRTQNIVLNKMPAFWMAFCRFCLSWVPDCRCLWLATILRGHVANRNLWSFTQKPFAQECLKAGIYHWVPNTWFYQYCRNVLYKYIYFFNFSVNFLQNYFHYLHIILKLDHSLC